MSHQMDSSDNTGTRLAHVEATVASVANNVNILANSFTSFSSEVRNEMRMLANQQSTSGKTNWGALGTWMGLVFTAMVIYTSLTIEPLRERIVDADNRHEAFRDRREQEAFERGKDRQQLADLLEQLKGNKLLLR